MWVRPNDNLISYRISTDVSTNEGGVSQTELIVGQWTHVSYVKNDNTLSLYIDGSLDSRRTLLGETISNDGVIQIGGTSYNSWLGADARFDDFLVFDEALTTLEVAYLASQRDPQYATRSVDVIDTDN